MADNRATEFMREADSCMEVAKRMSMQEDRDRMIQMADRWLELAREEMERKDDGK